MPRGKYIKCQASTKRGGSCQRWATDGALVCAVHGGQLPPVKKAAKERLRRAEDEVMEVLREHLRPAVQAIVDIMDDPTARPQDRQRAAETIIDRFLPKQLHAEVDGSMKAAERDLDAEIAPLLGEGEGEGHAEAG